MAVVVVALGMIGFATALGVLGKSMWVGGRDTRLSMLLQSQAERLKAQPRDALVDGAREDGIYQLAWSVDRASPAVKITLSAEYLRYGGGTAADTVVLYVAE